MVKFLRSCGPYQPGDTAKFSVGYEKRLIAERFAEEVKMAEKKDEPKRNPDEATNRQISTGTTQK